MKTKGSLISSLLAMNAMLDAQNDAILTAISASTGPIFTPRKHTVMTYGKQRRLAKQRRKSKNKR